MLHCLQGRAMCRISLHLPGCQVGFCAPAPLGLVAWQRGLHCSTTPHTQKEAEGQQWLLQLDEKGWSWGAAIKLASQQGSKLHLPSHNKSPHLTGTDSAGQMVSSVFRAVHVLKMVVFAFGVYSENYMKVNVFRVDTKIPLHWWWIFAWNTTHWVKPWWRSQFS